MAVVDPAVDEDGHDGDCGAEDLVEGDGDEAAVFVFFCCWLVQLIAFLFFEIVQADNNKINIKEMVNSQRNIASSNIRRKQTRKSHQFQILSRAQFRAMENSQSPQNEASE